MNTLQPQTVPPAREGEPEHERTTATPGQPDSSGYAEADRNEAPVADHPNPDAAGNQRAQVTGELPGTQPDPELPDEDTEETPPGENKREPIKDPDPADTKLHVQQGSH